VCSVVPASTELPTLSLHDALPIWSHQASATAQGAPIGAHAVGVDPLGDRRARGHGSDAGEAVAHGQDLCLVELLGVLVEGLGDRSEEHTSELQSRENLVCRLLLEK